MRYMLALAILTIFATEANAAEGRRTAAVGGFIAGAVTGFLVRDAMATPAQVVYVETQPRVVYVETQPRPSVMYVYVETQPRVVYVERREVRAWQPPIAHPFPQ
jgi:hypothetical protein